MKVFVKRYPSKGEFPKENDKDYCSNVGMVYFTKDKFYFRDEQLITFTNKVEWFLEEIVLPSDEEIYSESFKSDKTPKDFIKGANYILNLLKQITK